MRTALILDPALPLQAFGYPIDTAGMAGLLDVALSDAHADFFARDRVVVRIEQDLRPVTEARLAAMAEVPKRALADYAFTASLIQDLIDRWMRPWVMGDHYVTMAAWPTFEPFRTVTVLGGLLASVRRGARTLQARILTKP